MKISLLGGLLLIAAGVILLLIGIYGYDKKQELFSVGDFKPAITTTKNVPALRYIGSGCIGAGVILFLLGFAKRK